MIGIRLTLACLCALCAAACSVPTATTDDAARMLVALGEPARELSLRPNDADKDQIVRIPSYHETSDAVKSYVGIPCSQVGLAFDLEKGDDADCFYIASISRNIFYSYDLPINRPSATMQNGAGLTYIELSRRATKDAPKLTTISEEATPPGVDLYSLVEDFVTPRAIGRAKLNFRRPEVFTLLMNGDSDGLPCAYPAWLVQVSARDKGDNVWVVASSAVSMRFPSIEMGERLWENILVFYIPDDKHQAD